MCRKERITQRLYGLAQTSPCIFKNAAAVVRGSTIMSTGVNNNNRTKWGRTPPRACVWAAARERAEAGWRF